MPGMYFNPLQRVFLNLSGGTVTGDTFFTQGLQAASFSADTIYLSGSNLNVVISEIIISAITSSNFLSLSGGTVTGDTFFTQGLQAARLSGGTIYSGATDLSTILSQLISSSITSAYYLPLSGGTGGEYLFTGNTTGQTIFIQNDIIPISNISNLGTLSEKFAGLNVSGITANTLNAFSISATTMFSNGLLVITEWDIIDAGNY